MLEKLKTLAIFTQHILKRRMMSFPSFHEVFNQPRTRNNAEQILDFDKTMIHLKYQSVVLELKKAFSKD